MKILVTGGAGFIGSHLVDKLINQKHKVVVIDNLSTGKKGNINGLAKFYKIDIRNKQIDNIISKVKPEVVFHLAAQVNERKSIDDPIYNANINIIGSLNLLEKCIKYKVNKFVFASSGGCILGDAKIIPTPENYPPRPISPYGVSKLSIDYYLNYYKTVHKLNSNSLLFANVYGPRQNPEGEAGVVSIFIDQILKNVQPIINGTGTQTRDYIYVDDIVNAAIMVLKKNKIGKYNIGTGEETSVNKLFKMIVNISQKKVKNVHGPLKLGEQDRRCLDCQKAKKQLNWRSKIKLGNGLRLTYNWFKNEYKKNNKK